MLKAHAVNYAETAVSEATKQLPAAAFREKFMLEKSLRGQGSDSWVWSRRPEVLVGRRIGVQGASRLPVYMCLYRMPPIWPYLCFNTVKL